MHAIRATKGDISTASTSKLILMGLLVLWCPYVFVWFVARPPYPKAFRAVAIGWAVFWSACAILYLAIGGDRVS